MGKSSVYIFEVAVLAITIAASENINTFDT